MSKVRIRQLVFASSRTDSIETLQTVLGLAAPFVDPGVGEFGLTNGVFALGDQFVEIVVPNEPDTAAGRFMVRSGGLGGYMITFQTDDLGAVRARADANAIRRVWNSEHPDISASHMHPADMGAAIVSVDQPRPASAWRWAGPDWQGRSTKGAIIGATIMSPDPSRLAGRWAKVLNVPCEGEGEDWRLRFSDGDICVRLGAREYLSGFDLRIADPDVVIARARDAGWRSFETGFHAMGVDVSLRSD